MIGALIGAAATIGGSILGASSNKKAAKKAAGIAADNTAANNALTREIYGKNTANLSPFMNNGLAASNALNGLLLGSPAAPGQPASSTPASALYGLGTPASSMGGAMPEGFYPWDQPGHYGRTAEEVWAEQNPAIQAPQMAMQPGGVTAPPVNPWDQFRNSTNYQFRLNEGMGALNRNYAARGLLESGAAMKGINNYAQNFASNELGNYMALLSGQQNMGMAGASALAGVGQNMVNNVTANNNSGASAAANAALIGGQANGQMWGGIAGALGNLAGTFGSSYGGGIGGGATALPYGGMLPAWRT
jgi:hypothetical protein